MRKWFKLNILSVIVVLLVACSHSDIVIQEQEKPLDRQVKYAKLLDLEEVENKDAKLTEPVKDGEKSSSKKTKEKKSRSGKELQSAEGKLKDEEIQKMMIYMFDEVLKLTRKSSDSRNDWITNNRDRAIYEESTKLEDPLSKYVVRDFTYDVASEFLEYLNCECDARLPFYSTDLLTRFDVKEQTNDAIVVESITLGDGVLHGTSYGRWFLKQEDSIWKLDDYEYINYNYETHDSQITFEDIEDSFYVYDNKDEKIPVEFVEYYEDDGIRYLVIRYPEKYLSEYDHGPYRVFNTFTASFEDHITREYNEQHQ